MMLANNQFDGGFLFTGGNFMPSQSIQAADSSSSAKNQRPQSLLPLTVKQIAESYFSSEDNKFTLIVDGIEANFRVLGLMMNKVEKATDVSFWLDDGTGRIEFTRWISMTSDEVEMAAVENGMYVQVNGHMKEFQGKRHAIAFSIRPVTDFNDIALHFIECLHVHLENSRLKGKAPGSHRSLITSAPSQNVGKGFQSSLPSQFLACSDMDQSENDACKLVLAVFHEPAMLAHGHGLHVEEVFRRLGLPRSLIINAINYLVDVGHIYSTIDEYHFKSANNG